MPTSASSPPDVPPAAAPARRRRNVALAMTIVGVLAAAVVIALLATRDTGGSGGSDAVRLSVGVVSPCGTNDMQGRTATVSWHGKVIGSGRVGPQQPVPHSRQCQNVAEFAAHPPRDDVDRFRSGSGDSAGVARPVAVQLSGSSPVSVTMVDGRTFVSVDHGAVLFDPFTLTTQSGRRFPLP